MTDTANLRLPYIEASQAQKHVTHNDALSILDRTVHLSVLTSTYTSPPASPIEGDRHIVAAGATGDWSGHDKSVAVYSDGGWMFDAPKTGWRAWSVAEAALLVYDGTAWSSYGAPPQALDNLLHLGVGTTADATNPFSAKLNNALWTAKTVAEGGDGNLRYKLSKQAAANTLSLLFQDNYSARAEIGLCGDDDFHFKVSPDGSTWFEGLRINRANGKVSFPATGGPRETLSAARTYYVRTDGSDSNDGLTNAAGGAFLTIQKAIDKVAALDLGIYNATIQVADGTYSGSAVLKPVVGAGKVYLIGNTSAPQNCIIASAATPLSNLIGTVAPVVGWYVKGFELRNSGSGGNTNVFLSDGASVTFDGPMRLGANAGTLYGNIYAEKKSLLSFVGQALTVAASGPAFLLQAVTGAQIDGRNASISFLQNTTYAGTVYAVDKASIAVGGVTWTLNGYTITTTYWRYAAVVLATVDTNGGGANFIPGSTAGYTYNGGIYL